MAAKKKTARTAKKKTAKKPKPKMLMPRIPSYTYSNESVLSSLHNQQPLFLRANLRVDF
ncbi:MAG: hypothetical protein P8Y85_03130 [Nitrospirota bacterium]